MSNEEKLCLLDLCDLIGQTLGAMIEQKDGKDVAATLNSLYEHHGDLFERIKGLK